jgi:small subunit ribosomal protein S20
MANTPQAKKRIRRNARRAEINGARVSRIRTFVKAVEAALAAGDKAQAERRFALRSPSLCVACPRASSTRTQPRAKISRLTKRVAALG